MAVRGDRNYPSVYFGKPGALVTLPYPRDGIDKPYDRVAFDFVSGAGNHRVSQLIGGSRPFALEWRNLHSDNYALLEQFWSGMMGVGPWALVDPSQSNLLTGNQASATSLWNTPADWSLASLVAGFGALSSNANTTFIHRMGAPRSLKWHFATSPSTNPVLQASSPWSGWFGWPVVPSLSYSFSCWAMSSSMGTPTLAAKISWYDAAGGLISQSTGGDLATTTWRKLSVTATPPGGAVYAQPIIVGATFITGGTVYIDEPLFEQDTVVNNWVPGTGMRPVEIMGLTDQVPFNARFRSSIGLALREVG